MRGIFSAYWEEEKYMQGVEKHKERDQLKDLGVDGRVMLKWIIKKSNRIVKYGLDSSGSGQRQVAGSCKTVMELLVP